MTAFVALLRAVNVAGTGKLPMTELKAMCEAAGFEKVSTYIASGTVVFESARSEAQVKSALEAALAKYAGKPVGVLVRTAAEMAGVRDDDPFPEGPRNRTVAIFLDQPPPADAVDRAVGRADEQIALGLREIYVLYGEGMGHSKLRIPAAKRGDLAQYEHRRQAGRHGSRPRSRPMIADDRLRRLPEGRFPRLRRGPLNRRSRGWLLRRRRCGFRPARPANGGEAAGSRPGRAWE